MKSWTLCSDGRMLSSFSLHFIWFWLISTGFIGNYSTNISSTFMVIDSNAHLREKYSEQSKLFHVFLCVLCLEYNLWFLLLGLLVKFSFGSALDCCQLVIKNIYPEKKIRIISIEFNPFDRWIAFWFNWIQYTLIYATKRHLYRSITSLFIGRIFDQINFFSNSKVESTIMQINHQKIIFHAKGFFCVNYDTMLQVNEHCLSNWIVDIEQW